MRNHTQIFVQQGIDAVFTRWLWYARPPLFVRWKSADEVSSAPRRRPALRASSSHLPQGAAPTFPLLRALFALVVRPRRAGRPDSLEPRTLGTGRRRLAAGAAGRRWLARVGEGDAASGRADATHHAGAFAAAVADPAFGARGGRLASRAGAVRANAGRHLSGSRSPRRRLGAHTGQRQGHRCAEAHPSGRRDRLSAG